MRVGDPSPKPLRAFETFSGCFGPASEGVEASSERLAAALSGEHREETIWARLE